MTTWLRTYKPWYAQAGTVDPATGTAPRNVWQAGCVRSDEGVHYVEFVDWGDPLENERPAAGRPFPLEVALYERLDAPLAAYVTACLAYPESADAVYGTSKLGGAAFTFPSSFATLVTPAVTAEVWGPDGGIVEVPLEPRIGPDGRAVLASAGQGWTGKTGAVISVDTTKAAVAREAISAGARIVNDTSAMADEPGMAAVVRDSGCAVILMHRRGTPATMQDAPHYDSLFDEILAELSARIDAAVNAGIGRERILVDPGIGFGKRPTDNLALHRHLDKLRSLGRPIVFGSSRKGFLGTLTGAPADERIFATAASVAAAVLNGAHVLRVHEVREMREVVQVAAAIREAAEC